MLGSVLPCPSGYSFDTCIDCIGNGRTFKVSGCIHLVSKVCTFWARLLKKTGNPPTPLSSCSVYGCNICRQAFTEMSGISPTLIEKIIEKISVSWYVRI